MNTDKDWEKWGQKEPYFGVVSHDKYLTKNIDENILLDFFQSGFEHIEHILFMCRKHFNPNYFPKRALDFGCGVGRLAIPLASIATEVIGVDVSKTMIEEAQKNCNQRYQKHNCQFLKSDDDLSCLKDKFDFIHSFVVFQHIPPSRGRHLLKKLLDCLEPNGIGVIHFTYSKVRFKNNFGVPKCSVLRAWLQSGYRIAKRYWTQVMNSNPPMQMNIYELNKLSFLLQSVGIEQYFCEFTNHDGELGVLLYFQKPSEPCFGFSCTS